MKGTHKIAPTVESKEGLTIFIDGAGAKPDGTGSGFAWVCTTTKEKRIEYVLGLTNNQAEYRALIGALSALSDGTRVEVFSDSQLLCCQYDGTYRVKDPDLGCLLGQVQSLIKEKGLIVTLRWV